MITFLRQCLYAVVGLVLMTLPSWADDADPPSPMEGWSFSLAPYLWIVSLDMDMIVRPNTSTEIRSEMSLDFIDLLEELEFAFAGYGEARRGDWSLFGDAQYVRLSPSSRTPTSSVGPLTIGPSSLDLEFEATIIQIGVMYRIAELSLGNSGAEPNLAIHAVVSGRYTGMDIDARLGSSVSDPTGLIDRQIRADLSPNLDFFDPVIGGRLEYRMNPNWLATVYGDIGGFGVGTEFTWHLNANLSYRAWDSIDVLLGYRVMSYDIESDESVGLTEMDFTMHGPLLSVVFQW